MTDETGRPAPPPDPFGLTPDGGPPTSPSGARAARRRARRRRWVWGSVVVLVVLLGAGAAAVALTSSSSSSTKVRARRTRPTVTTSTAPTTTTTGSTSATTIIPKSSNPVVALAQQYDGSYTGTFKNTTFNTSGPASLDIHIDPTVATLAVNVGLNGDLFGGGAKAVRTIQGTIPLGNPSAAVATQTPSFGPVTGKLGTGLSVILTAPAGAGREGQDVPADGHAPHRRERESGPTGRLRRHLHRRVPGRHHRARDRDRHVLPDRPATQPGHDHLRVGLTPAPDLDHGR